MAQETATARGFAVPGLISISTLSDGTLAVSTQQLRVSKSKGENVTWERQGGGDFNILFNSGTPFDRMDYNQNTGKSLAPRQDAPLGTYKYTVQVTGHPDLDPQVIIDP
jgi:hypothetical protein